MGGGCGRGESVEPVSGPFRAMHRTAIDYHCRLGGETVHERFVKGFARDCVSIVVTVNSGYE